MPLYHGESIGKICTIQQWIVCIGSRLIRAHCSVERNLCHASCDCGSDKRSQRRPFNFAVLQSRGLEGSRPEVFWNPLFNTCHLKEPHPAWSSGTSPNCRAWRWRPANCGCGTGKAFGNQSSAFDFWSSGERVVTWGEPGGGGDRRHGLHLWRCWKKVLSLHGAVHTVVVIALQSRISWGMSSKFRPRRKHLRRSSQMALSWRGAMKHVVVIALKSRIS